MKCKVKNKPDIKKNCDVFCDVRVFDHNALRYSSRTQEVLPEEQGKKTNFIATIILIFDITESKTIYCISSNSFLVYFYKMVLIVNRLCIYYVS